jgi:hypothetical protein
MTKALVVLKMIPWKTSHLLASSSPQTEVRSQNQVRSLPRIPAPQQTQEKVMHLQEGVYLWMRLLEEKARIKV